jgi:pyruvate/2-oxoglutarate dehydrogenase complex dihydrolipoamide dehydrogenase (E3) component
MNEQAEIQADHLIVATNPHRRSIPDWVWALLGSRPGLLTFASDVDLRTQSDLTGQQVIIVGGGLTAAHLACGAAVRGADVHLVTRRPVETRSFDTDPGWLGPRHLDDFDADDDPTSRLATAREARGGGTIPPWMAARLEVLVHDGKVVTHGGRPVRAADVAEDDTCVVALDDQTTLEPDQIWLATGTIPDLGAARCLASLAADAPAIEGIPITDGDLRLGPHPVHVMGRLATLTLGPAAGNLWGAQRAASRITAALTGIDLDHEPMVPQQPRRRPVPDPN